MTQFLPRYAEAAVPRYTSYPTALQFHEIDEVTYHRWLRGIAGEEAVSVYLHVPFCARLCLYCGCATEVTRRPERVAGYAALLEQEIAMTAEAAGDRPPIRHLHFGGGTPTQLAPEDFTRLMTALDRHFGFEDGAERAVEIDPRWLSDRMIATLAESGINRVSLGIQDINEDVQEAIDRIQPLEKVAVQVEKLRAAGIGRISMDMIYGLPRQTVAHVKATARAIAWLGADRVAVFGYAHVPWFRKHQRAIDEAELPDAPERFRQMLAAAEALQATGFRNIGFDHFARPGDGLAIAAEQGRLRRNFQGYTDDQAGTLIGFGASSIGNLPGGYVQNTPVTNDWMKRIGEGVLPVTRGCAVSDEDRLRRALIEEVMCNGSVDAAAVCSDYGADADSLSGAFWRLERLRHDGLVDIDRDARIVTATDLGRLYLRNIAHCFDSYHDPSEQRHSRAI
jgi:oxygen-independent coproporphyrinogen-3 oxidase